MKAIRSPPFVAPQKIPWELSVALWAPWHPARTTQLETCRKSAVAKFCESRT